MKAIARARLQVVRADLDDAPARRRGSRRLRRERASHEHERRAARRSDRRRRRAAMPCILLTVPRRRRLPARAASRHRRATGATPRIGDRARARVQVAGQPPQHEVAARKRVGLAERAHRDVLRGPVADAGNGLERRRRSRCASRTSRTRSSHRPRVARARGSCRRAPASRPRVRAARSRAAPASETAARAQRRPSSGEPNSVAHPSRDRRRRADRDLLAEDGADRELEAVPRARRANARMLRERPREQRIGAQVLRDDRGIGAEIEHAPHPLDDDSSARGSGKRTSSESAGRDSGRDTTMRPVLSVDRDRAPIARPVDRLDAGRGARGAETRSTASQSYGGR